MYRNLVKRLLDILVAILGLIFLSPIIIFITIGLFIANHGKPFFFQLRPGKEEREFFVIKFKTMNDKKDDSGNLLSDSQRITKLGSFVRKTSLDEIPQLINILKGNMSLIGPRPLLIRYLPYYSEQEKKRHNVRPGITGLAQINGRNFLNWDDRLALDVQYVNNISLVTDLKILIITIGKVISAKDVAVDTRIIMKDLDEVRKDDRSIIFK